MKKNLFIAFILLAMTQWVSAQKFAKLDQSPVDIAYFPSDASYKGLAPSVKVVYSRPAKKGREIFGKLVPFGEVWRAGADEETEIRFYKDATIGGTTVPAGNYSFFIIPEKDSWTFIINKQTDRWGAYSYDKNLDVVRVKVDLKKASSPIENFSISIQEGLVLQAGWDNVYAELPIKM